ncbi:hypothetical protein MRX96_020639 [Rhipicephalus microplus]
MQAVPTTEMESRYATRMTSTKRGSAVRYSGHPHPRYGLTQSMRMPFAVLFSTIFLRLATKRAMSTSVMLFSFLHLNLHSAVDAWTVRSSRSAKVAMHIKADAMVRRLEVVPLEVCEQCNTNVCF